MVGVAFVCFAAEDDPPGYPMFRASSPGGAGAKLVPTPAGACSWSDIDRTNADRLIPEFFNYADAVVHGRVVSVQINEDGVQTAQVAVLRSFKGADSALQLVEHSGPCGYRFKVGERRIYFITGTTVGAAGVKRASSWMWAVLSGLDRTAEIAVVPKPVVKSSRVRIRNASKTPFFNVVVGGRSYGNIGPNCTTSYQRWPAAYRYSSVSLIADAEERKLGVIDYVGESPLGEGRFTYVLTYENRQLGMRTVKDGN
jgi:hypothetical protein